MNMPPTEKLLAWYDKNKRDLPWRRTSNPYKIWLSEIIMQQTRVNQGLSYYRRFIEKYPTIYSLAAATQDDVLKLWQGLGYYSRARNLHTSAKNIVKNFNGRIPESYDELIKLKGIGAYSAAAISSIAFHVPKPVVDGNVLRVISRWFALEAAIDTPAAKKIIHSILEKLIDAEHPGKFNQAIMEFGATCCKPKNPACSKCIFNDHCLAFQKNMVSLLPRKTLKAKTKNRFFKYLFVSFQYQNQTCTIIHKRNKDDIWRGLYDFPVVESATNISLENLLDSCEFLALTNQQPFTVISVSKLYIHQLTHQKIHAVFIHVFLENQIGKIPEKYFIVPVNTLPKYPVSRLMDKYLNDSIL